MKKGNLKKTFSALTAAAMLATALPVASVPTFAAGNIISNSTFDSGTSGWGTYKESGGACSLSTKDGQLDLTVSSVGRLNYSVQVFYDIIPLHQNGVYRLKYDISSDIERRVEGMIQQNGGTYQAYTWKGLNLSPTPQTVDYTFTMEKETDMMTKFVFNCGTQGEDLPEHHIFIDNVSLELVDDSQVDYSTIRPKEDTIVVNQVGYRSNAGKTAIIRNIEAEGDVTCSVVDDATGEAIYTATASGKQYAAAEEYDYVFDFSEVSATGTYHITCEQTEDVSHSFEISENPYESMLDDTVRMFYLQRCGTAVDDTAFGHISCHDTMAVLYGTQDTIDVSGGWHDAGDYGRYVVAGAKAVADLLYAYGANPTLYSDQVGIPESGNGVPDILDEVRYELEWMLKMQASSGGVYHKVTCENFPGYVMPQYETAQLIVTPISSTATADFCGSMAMAYEFYQSIDEEFAQRCLDAAKKAWDYLQANPNFDFKNPSDITTGDYGDYSDRDERYWAAAQMYRATGEQAYRTALEGMASMTGMDWKIVGDYGNIALLTMDGISEEDALYQRAKTAIINQATTMSKISSGGTYGPAISKFNWGSNMTISNAGVILALAYQLTGTEQYKDAAEAQLNYLLGCNPVSTCFVTGYGTVSPQNPHHRPSMAMKSSMKGMLVGGVNSALEDSAAKAYLADVADAKCYIDHSESYSTNEITIYWNSPLIYLLSLTGGSETSTDILGDVNADGSCTMLDVVMMQKYLVGLCDLTAPANGDMNADGRCNIFDMVLLKQSLS